MKDFEIEQEISSSLYLSLEDERESDFFAEESKPGYNQERDFITLDAWKKCRLLRQMVYEKILPNLPPEEKYALGTQLRRASQSTTLNIAEGYGRFHFKEGIQFYRIARGSLYEVKDLLIIAYDIGVINSDTYQELLKTLEDAKATLAGYILYVQRKIQS